MAQNYYKGTVYKLEALGQEIVHDRIIRQEALVYQSVFTPFVDLVTGNAFNDRENAESLIYDHHYSMASYLDENSLVPISKEEAASLLLKDAFGEFFSTNEIEQSGKTTLVLQKIIH